MTDSNGLVAHAYQLDKQAPCAPMLGIAPTIFADGAQGALMSNGLFRFNLYEDALVTHKGDLAAGEPPVERLVCARIIMTVGTAKAIHEWLGEALVKLANADMENAGEQ